MGVMRVLVGSSAVAAVLVAAMLSTGALAQSSGCSTALISLSPCLNYITGNETSPSRSCCTQLGSVVQSEPQCLCLALNGGASALGIPVNVTRALNLPGVCNVQTPPVSKCNNSTQSPTASPTTPSSSPSSPDSSTGNAGSKNVPTTIVEAAAATSPLHPVHFILGALLMLACTI